MIKMYYSEQHATGYRYGIYNRHCATYSTEYETYIYRTAYVDTEWRIWMLTPDIPPLRLFLKAFTCIYLHAYKFVYYYRRMMRHNRFGISLNIRGDM